MCQKPMYQGYFDESRDISENFGESHHCENLKFKNFGESRTQLGELQGSLMYSLFRASGYFGQRIIYLVIEAVKHSPF
jgi:hypothetical protein